MENNQTFNFEDIDVYSVFDRVKYSVVQPQRGAMSPAVEACCFRSAPTVKLVVFAETTKKIDDVESFEVEICDANDNVILTSFETALYNGGLHFFIEFEEPPHDDYMLYIARGGERVYWDQLIFVDYKESYDKYFKVEKLGFRRLNDDDLVFDQEVLMDRDSLRCFDQHNLAGVVGMLQVSCIAESIVAYQFSMEILNSRGESIHLSSRSFYMEPEERHFLPLDVYGVVCLPDTYTVILKFLDEDVVTTQFVVGDCDVV